MSADDCTAPLVTLLAIEDGPCSVEVIGCRPCNAAVAVFVSVDGHTRSVATDCGLDPEAAARQAVQRFTERAAR